MTILKFTDHSLPCSHCHIVILLPRAPQAHPIMGLIRRPWSLISVSLKCNSWGTVLLKLQTYEPTSLLCSSVPHTPNIQWWSKHRMTAKDNPIQKGKGRTAQSCHWSTAVIYTLQIWLRCPTCMIIECHSLIFIIKIIKFHIIACFLT